MKIGPQKNRFYKVHGYTGKEGQSQDVHTTIVDGEITIDPIRVAKGNRAEPCGYAYLRMGPLTMEGYVDDGTDSYEFGNFPFKIQLDNTNYENQLGGFQIYFADAEEFDITGIEASEALTGWVIGRYEDSDGVYILGYCFTFEYMPTIDSFEKLFHINFRIKLNGEMVCGLIPDNDFFELTTIADPSGAPYISTYQLGPCLSTNPGPGPGLCGPHGSMPWHEDCIKRHDYEQ